MIFWMLLLCVGVYAMKLLEQEANAESERRRLRACGLDTYVEKDELQKALDFENKRTLLLDAVNRARNTQVQRNWINRGRKMGVIRD